MGLQELKKVEDPVLSGAVHVHARPSELNNQSARSITTNVWELEGTERGEL